MDISDIARHEVDASVDEWRARTERGIANGRLIYYAAMTLVSVFSYAAERHLHPFPAPFVWYAAWTLVALLLRRARVRIAHSTTWITATIVLDISSVALTGFALHSIEVAAAPWMGVVAQPAGVENLFFTGVTAVSLLIFAAAHSLRSEARIAWIAYGAAACGYAADAVFRRVTSSPVTLADAILDGRWLQFSGTADFITFLAFIIAGRLGARAADATRDRMFAFARLTILKRMVPAAAAARVGDGLGREVSLAGERVTVTILASDLRGFTSMSEKLSPEQTVRELNAYHAAMLGVIEKHGGMLDKFIGDGALVVFGPESKDDGASAAVACAREMIDALVDHNRARALAGSAPLAIGIGIHTGDVVSGVIGAGSRLEWTVIGDAVNTASRIESMTKEVKVPALVTATTVERLADTSGLKDLGEQAVRGRAEGVRVFAIQGNESSPEEG